MALKVKTLNDPNTGDQIAPRTLVEAIIDRDGVNLGSTLKGLDTNKASNADLDVVSKRISNLVANTGEQTEGNAELIDIRVGADGTQYETAGDAVRGQVSQLLEEKVDLVREIINADDNIHNLLMNNTFEYVPVRFVHGGLDLTTGEITEYTTVAMEEKQEPISLLSDEVIVKIADGYRIRGCIYDENKNYLDWFKWISGENKPLVLQNRKGCYINFYLGNSDGSAIDLELIPTDVVKISFGNVTPLSQIEEIINGTIKCVSDNIINPKAFSSINGYYDFNDGVTVVLDSSIYTSITPSYISIDEGIEYLYVITSCVSTEHIFLAYCYSDTEYLGYANTRFTESGTFKLALKSGTTRVRFYSNAPDFLDYQICVSTSQLEEYVEYSPKYYVKEDALLTPDSGEEVSAKKVIVNFGDSIFGNKRPPNDISTMLSKITGATVYNLGFGGCRMAKHSTNWDAFSMYNLAYAVANNDFTLQNAVDVSSVSGMPAYFEETRELLENIDFNNVDIVTIAYGTNDFTAGVSLDNEENLYDTATFAGALRYSIETLLGAFPHLKIFICGQTYRFWMDSNSVFTEDSDTKTVNGGIKLTDFVVKTKEVCEQEYHCKFIDNYYEVGINKHNRSYYFPLNDGTHHNVLGAQLLAEHIASELF